MGRARIIRSVLFVFGFALVFSETPLHAVQQRNDEKVKIGNGALLRRMFGAGDAAKDSAKQSLEKARTAQKEALDATRQRLSSDAEKLKEKLGLKQPDENTAQAEAPPADQSKGEPAKRALEPRNQFAPKAPQRRSIADDTRERTPATAISGATPRTNLSNSLETKPNASSSGAPNRLKTQARDVQVPELSITDAAPAPRNQPRVPAQPTFATPPPATSIASQGTDVPAVEMEDPKPQPKTFGAFGVIVSDDVAEGLRIKAVKPKSVAANIGLRPGDTIKNVAGLDVTVVEEIDSLVEVLEPEDEFEITFSRDGKPQTQNFSIPKK
ncbi:MAG: PDZ domain-containing protein [Planctomycetaceae bacterium]|nr:PDZ domain-containing protein [Planctomycetaceae bacterium]